jgi:protein TonB
VATSSGRDLTLWVIVSAIAHGLALSALPKLPVGPARAVAGELRVTLGVAAQGQSAQAQASRVPQAYAETPSTQPATRAGEASGQTEPAAKTKAKAAAVPSERAGGVPGQTKSAAKSEAKAKAKAEPAGNVSAQADPAATSETAATAPSQDSGAAPAEVRLQNAPAVAPAAVRAERRQAADKSPALAAAAAAKASPVHRRERRAQETHRRNESSHAAPETTELAAVTKAVQPVPEPASPVRRAAHAPVDAKQAVPAAEPDSVQASESRARSSRAPAPLERSERLASADPVPAPREAAPAVAGAASTETTVALAAPASAASEPSGKGRRDELMALLHREISRHKRYPLIARRQQREGRATISFRLYPDGRMDHVSVAHSSGFQPLDDAALEAVDGVAPFEAAGHYLAHVERFEVNVVFTLY